MPDSTTIGCFRYDGLAVVVCGATLPPRCIRCNAPAVGNPRKFTFTWNPHGLHMGRSLFTLAAVATNHRGNVYGYYCVRHQRRIGRVMTTSAITIVLGAFLVSLGSNLHWNPLMTAGGCLAILPVGILPAYFLMPPPWIKCVKIEGKTLLLEMSCREFVANLPPMEGLAV